jgi:hypothetical protein
MRALALTLVSALIGLWIYYGSFVAQRDAAAPVLVEQRGGEDEVSAASLNNTGVRLFRQGRPADALAYVERAGQFRPEDPVIRANVERLDARVARRGWRRVLIPGSAAAVLLLLLSSIWHVQRSVRDHSRLGRVRLRGEPWFRIPSGSDETELALRFSEPVDRLLERHPLQIVWSCASFGKHMKSRPPVDAEGKRCTVRLNRKRLDQLRRFPGDWKGFLYLGKTPVGETTARVV